MTFQITVIVLICHNDDLDKYKYLSTFNKWIMLITKHITTQISFVLIWVHIQLSLLVVNKIVIWHLNILSNLSYLTESKAKPKIIKSY